MSVERTLSIIKPDAVAKNHVGNIYNRFEAAGLKIVAARMKHLTPGEAEGFYAVHRERPFFPDLVSFMVSGPVVVQVLEGDNAIAVNRMLMGATNPKAADPGTIRADFAESIDANAVHGSDSKESAVREISYFFNGDSSDSDPQIVVMGDLNFGNVATAANAPSSYAFGSSSATARNALFTPSATTTTGSANWVSQNAGAWSWTSETHTKTGNIGLSDGSVQGVTISGFHTALQNSTNTTSAQSFAFPW